MFAAANGVQNPADNSFRDPLITQPERWITRKFYAFITLFSLLYAIDGCQFIEWDFKMIKLHLYIRCLNSDDIAI